LWAEAELPIEPSSICGVEHPTNIVRGIAIDDLPYKLESQTPPPIGLQHIYIRKVSDHSAVRDHARETNLVGSVVDANDAGRATNCPRYAVARASLSPI
jgi:hypothetical protein